MGGEHDFFARRFARAVFGGPQAAEAVAANLIRQRRPGFTDEVADGRFVGREAGRGDEGFQVSKNIYNNS
ncbi:MAG: hypothetical protein AAB217_18470 [Chloroflexota bacterium]